ncbi:putative peroxisome membrane protein, Pex16 [Lupinus albus]|uniref:Peroxisomal membrane protein PEX16 n=1 Tax=Lupinus albus TaxID=3870 RepID=A0A6A4NNB8_LUPAL|nr:putative peroxisome membrane protein, Pex16 [Lupinus albus]
MEAYKRWVRHNKDYVQSLETLANGLTWVLPDQFLDSEIGPEAVTSILGIITSINEHIIDTTPTQDITDSIEAYSFPHSLCLSVIMCLETLVEVMAEQYYGDDKKWNFLAVTEATKVLVRLSLFRKSGYKMLLSGVETSNDETDSNTSNSQDETSLKPGSGHALSYMENNHSPNPNDLEGRALSALSRFAENAIMVPEPVSPSRADHNQRREAILESPVSVIERPLPRLFDILSKRGLHGALFFIGEVLFITRPLVYVLFIRKYGVRSWTPWFISMAFDCIGMSFLSLVATAVAGRKEQRFHLSASEKDEVKRRKLLFLLYIMRDPFFTKYTRKKLESVEKVLEPVPVIGFLTAKAVELAIGVQTRYTYMSGS